MNSTDGHLPAGWTTRTIGKVAGKPQYGWTTRAKQGDGVKLLRTTDITSGTVDWDSVPTCEKVPDDPTKYALHPGDIVVSRAGSVGFSSLIDDACPTNAVFASYLIRIHPDPALVRSRFLRHYMQSPSYWRQVQDASVGIGLANVNASKLASMTLPIPPLDEQDSLVSLLDQLDLRHTSAAAHLTRSKRAIERFRQAVLAAACSGRLTLDWRERHAPADVNVLLDGVDSLRRNGHPAPPEDFEIDIPDGWALASLDRLTAIVTSGSRGWAKHYAEEGPMFIRAQNINRDRLDLSDVAHVRPPSGSEGERTKVRKNDLLVTITGANVTRSAHVDRDIGEAYVNQHVALARPLVTEMAGYLHLWTVSPDHGRRKLAADAYGAGKPGLNLDNLRTMPVAVPSLEEQFEILKRMKALLTRADDVDARAMAAARSIEQSSQAVLTKAFRGEMNG